jgi:hypothetical protein
MTSTGRRLVVAMVVLLICDVIGGFIGLATGAETAGTAWGFDTHSTVPLPMGAAQLGLAWLAARDVRPWVGFAAAILLSAICLMSVLFGFLDGDLIGNVASDGVVSWGVVWGVVWAVPLRHCRGRCPCLRSGQAAPPASLRARRRSPRSGVGPRLCNLSVQAKARMDARTLLGAHDATACAGVLAPDARDRRLCSALHRHRHSGSSSVHLRGREGRRAVDIRCE